MSDPAATALISEATKDGFASVLLVAIVLALVYWIRGMEVKRTEREAEARKECLERERALADRLTKLEDRSSTEKMALLERSTIALEASSRVIERLCDNDTDLHRALRDS